MPDQALKILRVVTLVIGIMSAFLVVGKIILIDSYKICVVEASCIELSKEDEKLEERIKRTEEFIFRLDERMISVQNGIGEINKKLDKQ